MPNALILCVLCGTWYPFEAESAEPYFGCCGLVECRCSTVSAVRGFISPAYVEKAYLAQQAVMLGTMEAA